MGALEDKLKAMGCTLPPVFKFKKSGKSGVEVSEIFPKIGECIDDVAVIRSMHTDIPAHEFATVMMNTGSGRMVKPSMGASRSTASLSRCRRSGSAASTTPSAPRRRLKVSPF